MSTFPHCTHVPQLIRLTAKRNLQNPSSHCKEPKAKADTTNYSILQPLLFLFAQGWMGEFICMTAAKTSSASATRELGDILGERLGAELYRLHHGEIREKLVGQI